MIQQLISEISILFTCYERLLQLRKYMIVNPQACMGIHWNCLHNVMYDHSALIICALFREGAKKKDNIHYLNLLNNNKGLGTLVKKSAGDEAALTALIENKSGIKIGNVKNLERYRHDIKCHPVDYDPEQEVIYFPILFGFVKNAKALVDFLNDLYNKNPSFKERPASFEGNVKHIQQQFANIEQLYNDTKTNAATSNVADDFSDVRSRLLARQNEIVSNIVHYYALSLALEMRPETELIIIWKRAVYSELVLNIWGLFGKEDDHNKWTHFNRLLEEYEKFCNENAVRLQQVKGVFSKWIDLQKLIKLIDDVQKKLAKDRNSIAHVDIKNLSYQYGLIKECAEICCELWPFIEVFRCYSHKLSSGNEIGFEYNRVGIIDYIRRDFEKALIQFFSIQ